jgi:hypothetical protein
MNFNTYKQKLQQTFHLMPYITISKEYMESYLQPYNFSFNVQYSNNTFEELKNIIDNELLSLARFPDVCIMIDNIKNLDIKSKATDFVVYEKNKNNMNDTDIYQETLNKVCVWIINDYIEKIVLIASKKENLSDIEGTITLSLSHIKYLH